MTEALNLLPAVASDETKQVVVIAGPDDGATHWRAYEELFPDVAAITADGWVSVLEPFRGYITWSWRVGGRRVWREGRSR